MEKRSLVKDLYRAWKNLSPSQKTNLKKRVIKEFVGGLKDIAYVGIGSTIIFSGLLGLASALSNVEEPKTKYNIIQNERKTIVQKIDPNNGITNYIDKNLDGKVDKIGKPVPRAGVFYYNPTKNDQEIFEKVLKGEIK